MESGDDLTFDERDSAPFMPKCVVVDPNFDWKGEVAKHHVPWGRTIVYEAHVRGFTRLRGDIDERLRGTYAGLGQPPVVDYIRALGVSSVELLPVHTFIDDKHLLEKGLHNYWGYNSIGFFAPDPRYAADHLNTLREFKEMVARYHEAGLEIILDVVYNHTAEGNEKGPTLSFKGIDNASYYRLLPDQQRYYINDTGTGNTVNLSHIRVIQMVTDSLRYWAQEMHVDGFRFDLGTILAREPERLRQSERISQGGHAGSGAGKLKFIAEPWDCGPGGYQVGGFPPGWAEWNDQFRNTARGFWIGETPAGALGAAAVRIGRHLQSPGTPALVERQFRHCARRLHAGRPGQLQREAQRSQWRGQSRRQLPTTAPGTAVRKVPPRTRPYWPARRASSAIFWQHCCCPRARRCCSPAMNSRAPSAATTMPTARTTRSAGSTGMIAERQRGLQDQFVRQLTGLRDQAFPYCAADVS